MLFLAVSNHQNIYNYQILTYIHLFSLDYFFFFLKGVHHLVVEVKESEQQTKEEMKINQELKQELEESSEKIIEINEILEMTMENVEEIKEELENEQEKLKNVKEKASQREALGRGRFEKIMNEKIMVSFLISFIFFFYISQ